MKQYVWLNPVVLSMYEARELRCAVGEAGFEIVECGRDHIGAVKKKYGDEIKKAGVCVMDMRCPAAAELARDRYGDADVVYPDIHPILIHCAAELSERLGGTGSLTVTTPCTELKDLGNSLGLPGTRFVTWKEFVEEQGIHIRKRELEKSPIPPGFFSEWEGAAKPLASREKIEAFFEKREYEAYRVAEMLACREGCHNGNGV